MITEDYVSFETAKLLKEKGFYGECLSMYLTPKPNCGMGNPYEAKLAPHGRDSHYYDGHLYQCEAPTLQMAMKWLREDKKILISIFCHIDKGYWFCIQHFINSPYKFATSESIHRKEEILGKIQYYDTYEQACDAAIKYCLENLI